MKNKILDSIEINDLIASTEKEPKGSAIELLKVFSETGDPIGLAPRLICHRLGLLHKVVFCFIGAPDGRLMLQTRKDGRLDVAVGGHMSSEDESEEHAILREIHEEIGIDLSMDRLQKITEYQRRCTARVSKPQEMNNELRELFFVQLSNDECEMLDTRFLNRIDKLAVIRVQWFNFADILKACNTDQAADGLAASISHFLLWLLNQNK